MHILPVCLLVLDVHPRSATKLLGDKVTRTGNKEMQIRCNLVIYRPAQNGAVLAVGEHANMCYNVGLCCERLCGFKRSVLVAVRSLIQKETHRMDAISLCCCGRSRHACACMHTHTSKYTHTYTYTCTHTRVHTRPIHSEIVCCGINAAMASLLHQVSFLCTCVYVYVCVNMRVCTCVCACACMLLSIVQSSLCLAQLSSFVTPSQLHTRRDTESRIPRHMYLVPKTKTHAYHSLMVTQIVTLTGNTHTHTLCHM